MYPILFFQLTKEMKKDDDIEYMIADTLIERPHAFYVSDRLFYLYPVTIGKNYLLMRNVEALGIDKKRLSEYPFLEILRICKHKKDTVLRIVTYHTFNKKSQIFDDKLVTSRVRFFGNNISDEDLAQLLIFVLNNDKTEQYIKHFGIDKENEYKSKVSRLKSETSTAISLGGRSIYGTLIDFACERYGWSYDYVVWGISYANLKMLMNDSISTHYLSKEESRKLHIPKDRTVVSADDRENLEKMKKYFND